MVGPMKPKHYKAGFSVIKLLNNVSSAVIYAPSVPHCLYLSGHVQRREHFPPDPTNPVADAPEH